VSSYRLIEAERTSFPAQFMCRMLGVSRSGYYDWRGRPPSSRNRENATLTSKIREVQRRSRETYGSPRVHAELKALGTRCSRKRVARLMRQAGLRGCIRGRRKSTTRRSGRAVPAKDLLQRSFAATKVDRVWVADITYVPTQEGFLYLAFILDVYSRRIVGWAMERMLRTTPVRMLTGDIVTSCTYQPAFRAMRPRETTLGVTAERNLAKLSQDVPDGRWPEFGYPLLWNT
jgi:putative transposase